MNRFFFGIYIGSVNFGSLIVVVLDGMKNFAMTFTDFNTSLLQDKAVLTVFFSLLVDIYHSQPFCNSTFFTAGDLSFLISIYMFLQDKEI